MIIYLLTLLLQLSQKLNETIPLNEVSMDSFLLISTDEKKSLMLDFDKELFQLQQSRHDLSNQIHSPTIPLEDRFNALIQYNSVMDTIHKARNLHEIEMICFRYRKGIEVLKMIYEKILSLDHHFTGLSVHQNISVLSNPNSYPDFVKVKDELKSKTNRKHKVALPGLLDNNPLFSIGYAMLYSFFGSGDNAEKSAHLNDISCLLDFTLMMQTDLKIIFYEIDYLKIQNEDLRKDCLELFDNYINVINYNFGLEFCRANDDWEKIYLLLSKYKDELNESVSTSQNSFSVPGSTKEDQLKFAMDLLMNFINSYSHFVYLGEMYYEKFLVIIKNYQNSDLCRLELPKQYEEIEKEILYSIEKFESAYDLVELRGSKLRELLYGVP